MKRIAYILKNNKGIYFLYHVVVSFLLRVIGSFIQTDHQLILFNSFGGKKCDDSPKAIYDAMIDDPRFASFRLVWVIQEPEKLNLPENMSVVKCDTPEFFLCALKAGCWVTNSSMERGLNFKKKNTVYFNTWHGTPIKKMGTDIDKASKSFSATMSPVDVMLAQGQHDIDVFSRVFSIEREKFHCIGLPRNDVLSHYAPEYAAKLRDQLNIPKETKVILYAPTFREYEQGTKGQCTLHIPMNLEYWKERLGEDYMVLFRAHYEVAEHMNVNQCTAFRDVSQYPTLNDLMIVSDLLVTDYSSICFDYAIMEKPIFCFAYDYEEYKEKRGIYFELTEQMPCGIVRTEEELLNQILNANEADCRAKTCEFRDKFVTAYGNAAKQSCDLIEKMIEG